MGRMAERWEEGRSDREQQAIDEIELDWQAVLKADPAWDKFLDEQERTNGNRGER